MKSTTEYQLQQDWQALSIASNNELVSILEQADALDEMINTRQPEPIPISSTISWDSVLEIVFLGSLGSRYGALLGGSGGFWLNLDGNRLLCDPGPSCISILARIRSMRSDVALECLDAILCSHLHQDHSGNLLTSIEGMTWGMRHDRGRVIANETVIRAIQTLDKYYFNKTTPYILSLKQCTTEISEEIVTSNLVELGLTQICATPTLHKEVKGQLDTGIGFYFSGSNCECWYTSDTALFDDLVDTILSIRQNHKPLIVVANAGCTHARQTSLHLRNEDLFNLINRINPSYVLIQHYDEAYSSVNYRISQSIYLQRRISDLNLKTIVLPSANGLSYTIQNDGTCAVRALLNDKGTILIADYVEAKLRALS